MNKETQKTQMQAVYEAFRERPKTTKIVSVETGIQRCNITRYVATWEKRNLITTVKKAKCPVTKHEAKFYSTDPARIPELGQQALFDPPPNKGPYAV